MSECTCSCHLRREFSTYPGRRVRQGEKGLTPASGTLLTAFWDPAELPARRFGKRPTGRSNPAIASVMLMRRCLVAVVVPACPPLAGVSHRDAPLLIQLADQPGVTSSLALACGFTLPMSCVRARALWCRYDVQLSGRWSWIVDTAGCS